MNWYIGVIKNYVGFSGRARRTEYWTFFGINLAIATLLTLTGKAIDFPLLASLYSLALLLPSLAVGFRRLHDTGRSAGWLFIVLIPFAGAIALVVFFLLPGTVGPNQYGPDPKQQNSR